MKTTLSDPKRYLLHYILFSLLFVCALLCLILLGNRFSSPPLDADGTALLSAHAERPVVILDAGHGGEDGGAVGANGIYEKDLNLAIAQALCEMLRANGIEVVMTRNEDILLYDKSSDYQGQKKVQDLATRKKIAEQYESAVFVSIHMNAFPQAQYHGLQVYYSKNHEDSRTLAQALQSLTQSALQPDNHRKIKEADGNIFLLDRLHCPAILIECGFLSNPEECAALSDVGYRQQLSLLICQSLLEYFSLLETNPSGGT